MPLAVDPLASVAPPVLARMTRLWQVLPTTDHTQSTADTRCCCCGPPCARQDPLADRPMGALERTCRGLKPASPPAQMRQREPLGSGPPTMPREAPVPRPQYAKGARADPTREQRPLALLPPLLGLWRRACSRGSAQIRRRLPNVWQCSANIGQIWSNFGRSLVEFDQHRPKFGQSRPHLVECCVFAWRGVA